MKTENDKKIKRESNTSYTCPYWYGGAILERRRLMRGDKDAIERAKKDKPVAKI